MSRADDLLSTVASDASGAVGAHVRGQGQGEALDEEGCEEGGGAEERQDCPAVMQVRVSVSVCVCVCARVCVCAVMQVIHVCVDVCGNRLEWGEIQEKEAKDEKRVGLRIRKV